VFKGREDFKRGAATAWGPFDASQHSMSNTVREPHPCIGSLLPAA
jgi:hypothetical protein